MKLHFSLDEGYGSKPAIGVVVLSTDETIEPEFRQIHTNPETSVFHSRIHFEPVVTPETLADMERALPASLSLFSRHIEFSAIGYGCTSGATVIGAKKIAAIVQEFFPGVPVSDPISAVIAACRALRVSKLGLLTPYSLDVSATMQSLLEHNGLQVSSFASFEETQDHRVARITEQSILDGILQMDNDDCDSIFVSCTSLRCFGIIDEAEKRLGKPVISSNSAFAWHLHKLAGSTQPVQGPGTLFRM